MKGGLFSPVVSPPMMELTHGGAQTMEVVQPVVMPTQSMACLAEGGSGKLRVSGTEASHDLYTWKETDY